MAIFQDPEFVKLKLFLSFENKFLLNYLMSSYRNELISRSILAQSAGGVEYANCISVEE